MEGWKTGRVEGWKTGILVDWEIGELGGVGPRPLDLDLWRSWEAKGDLGASARLALGGDFATVGGYEALGNGKAQAAAV